MREITCPVCNGTGKSQVQVGATNGFVSAGMSDFPPCAKCHATGFVDKLDRRDRDLFDVLGWIARAMKARR